MKTKFNPKDVPSWAKWIAVDRDGECAAFSYKPKPCGLTDSWDNKRYTRFETLYKGSAPKNWKTELYTWDYV